MSTFLFLDEAGGGFVNSRVGRMRLVPLIEIEMEMGE